MRSLVRKVEPELQEERSKMWSGWELFRGCNGLYGGLLKSSRNSDLKVLKYLNVDILLVRIIFTFRHYLFL